jgi:superfamily I DNA/RNA helicase
MAKRAFKLPGVQDLNKDQDSVLMLPKAGQHLIIGGPGTGKSVVALLRVMQFRDDNDYIFLVYNKVLETSTKQLLENNLKSKTWKWWFFDEVESLINEPVPKLDQFTPDFDSIISKLEILSSNNARSLQLIIDEGQDMPPKFYEAIICMGIKNIFVVADQNQQLTEQHSNRTELTTALGLEFKDVIELTQNWRNSYDIALLARHFYTDPSSDPPNLPSENNKSIKSPILFEYLEEDKTKMLATIIRKFDLNPSYLIGVIVPNNKVLEYYLNGLNELIGLNSINLDNPPPNISSYRSGTKVNINFGEGGIVVLNSQSVKGLEFDVVFIADINEFRIRNNDLDPIKKSFYVMISRAIRQVILLKRKGATCDVDSILPIDQGLLKVL